jgi:hypothetical protein
LARRVGNGWNKVEMSPLGGVHGGAAAPSRGAEASTEAEAEAAGRNTTEVSTPARPNAHTVKKSTKRFIKRPS